MKKITEYVFFSISLVLMGLGIIFKDDLIFANILIIAGIVVLLFVVALKYIPFAIQTYYEWRIKPLRLSSEDQKNPLEEIIKTAARDGGELLTTSILHKDLSVESDWAIKHFRNSTPKDTLVFKRLLLVDDIHKEHKWLNAFFESISGAANVNVTLYVFKKFSLFLSPLIERFIPRINLILFHQGTSYYVYIGFDRLYREDPRHFTSIGFFSQSRKVYCMIKPYYDALISHDNIIGVHSIDELHGLERIKYQQEFADSAITQLQNLAFETRQILHIGIFGSQAKIISGIYSSDHKEPFDSDTDIVLIVPSRDNINPLKDRIQNHLLTDYSVVWGDDDTQFYQFRHRAKPTVDIEIFERGNNFYTDHLLLGISVFFYYHSLYLSDGTNLSDILPMPSRNLTGEQRHRVFLDSRKGLVEFISRLSKNQDTLVDPRRIISLTLRNLVWLHSGNYPENHTRAIQYLSRPEITFLLNGKLTHARRVLQMDQDKIQANYPSVQNQTLDILKTIQTNIVKISAPKFA